MAEQVVKKGPGAARIEKQARKRSEAPVCHQQTAEFSQGSTS